MAGLPVRAGYLLDHFFCTDRRRHLLRSGPAHEPHDRAAQPPARYQPGRQGRIRRGPADCAAHRNPGFTAEPEPLTSVPVTKAVGRLRVFGRASIDTLPETFSYCAMGKLRQLVSYQQYDHRLAIAISIDIT